VNNGQRLLMTRIALQGYFKNTLVSSTGCSANTRNQRHDKHVTCLVSNIYHTARNLRTIKAKFYKKHVLFSIFYNPTILSIFAYKYL